MKNLTLFVTNKCNSKCIMCFNTRLNKKENELSLGEYEKISKHISDLDELFISGGEPSLRQDLDKICYYFYKNCVIKKIKLPMNGQLTNETVELAMNILNLCPNSELSITLALDGLKEIHDKQRGVKGSFDKVIKTYNKLSNLAKKNKKLKIGFVTTVTKINYHNLKELTDFTKKLSSQPLYHNLMACRMQSSNVKNKLIISSEEFGDLLLFDQRLRKRMMKNNYSFFKRKLIEKFNPVLNNLYLNAYSGKKIINCRAVENSRVIEANGDVRVCEMKQVIGNIRNSNYDLDKILISQKFKFMVKDCCCIHPCFVIPSLKSPLNLLRSIKSYFFG